MVSVGRETHNDEMPYHQEAPLCADLEVPKTPCLGQVRLLVELLVRDRAEALRVRRSAFQSRWTRDDNTTDLILFFDRATGGISLEL